MSQFPSSEWMKLYEEKQPYLKAYSDFNAYFSADQILGMKMHHLNMGKVKFPTGEIFVCDPLVYLDPEEEPYFVRVPKGEFPIETLVIEIEEGQYSFVAVRIKFTEEEATQHIEALKGTEQLEELGEDEYFGFHAESGLATVVDVATREAFCAFVNRWEYENSEDKNLYDDYLAVEFAKSYQNNPEFQRESGDWINFQIPGSDLSLPMIQTGFGQGTYPVYFGYDQNGKVCELVIQFIDIELAFSEAVK